MTQKREYVSQTTAQLRLEALRIALTLTGNYTSADLIKNARAIEDYVFGK